MANIEFKSNKEGLKQLRKHPAMQDGIVRKARAVARAAGGEEMGYMVTDLVLEKPRAAVSVMATGKAAQDNRKHNRLMRSIDAARD